MDEEAATRTAQDIESEIIGLHAAITVSTYQFLRLLLDYDAIDGWRAWGANSLAGWLSWQCGISEIAAREQVRVARCLDRFPLIAAEFAAGRLSYSKVRAITRVATAETEQLLLDTAMHSSAAQLEQIVAGQRRVIRGEDARVRRSARFVNYRWDADGSLVGSFRLPPEEAAVFLSSLLTERDRLQREASDVSAETSEITSASTNTPDPAAESFGLVPEQPDDAVDEIERPSPPARLADALVALARRPTGTQAAGPATVNGDPTDSRDVTGETQLVVVASAESLAREDDDAALDPVLLEWALGHPALRIHPITARRMTCGCPTQFQINSGRDGNALHLGRRTRRIRARLAAAIHRRDHGRCRAPGCRRTTTQIHHIDHWSRGGPTCIDNLISLCDQHHWLVHEGGWSIRGDAATAVFHRADGRAVTVIPAPRELPAITSVKESPDGIAYAERLDLPYVISVINQRRDDYGMRAS